MSRIVGIRHRVKKTAQGEARPTEIAIKNGALKPRVISLATEDDEIDLVFGRIPVKWRAVAAGEPLGQFLPRHLQHQKPDKEAIKALRDRMKAASGEEKDSLRVLLEEAQAGLVSRVPTEFEGLKPYDTAVMVLGGSGNYLAYAVCRRLAEIGGALYRITPNRLAAARGKAAKEEDHLLLAELFASRPDLFHKTELADLKVIALQVTLKARLDQMRDRIAAEQRLHQLMRGAVFLDDNLAPEHSFQDAYLKAKNENPSLEAMRREETRRISELKKALHVLPAWKLFERVEGCGELIAARIVAGVGDIRRFPDVRQFKKFCGVHVGPDGRFARYRAGEVGGWQPNVRQAFFLLADQWNKRPESEWGQRLRACKTRFRERHPEPVATENGKKRYTDIHIHRMASWRVITKFAEKIYKEWRRLESS